jgi:hypothetical protein
MEEAKHLKATFTEIETGHFVPKIITNSVAMHKPNIRHHFNKILPLDFTQKQ